MKIKTLILFVAWLSITSCGKSTSISKEKIKINKIVCSSGPVLYRNVEINSNGEYFFAGEIYGEEAKFNGLLENHFRGKVPDSSFEHFANRIINSGLLNYDTSQVKNVVPIGDSWYCLNVYYNDTLKSIGSSNLPDSVSLILESLVESYKDVKLTKVKGEHFFETQKCVYPEIPKDLIKNQEEIIEQKD